MTQQEKDMTELLGSAAFRRFLFRSIQMAGILGISSNGRDGRDLAFSEGRRSLGLDILRDVDAGQPAPLRHPHSIMTLIAALREEVDQPLKEKPNARDRYSEVSE